MSFNDLKHENGLNTIVLLSAIVFAILSLALLFELITTKSKLYEFERKLAENRIKSSMLGSKSLKSEKGDIVSNEIKRLEKEVDFWKNKSKGESITKSVDPLSAGKREELYKFLFMSNDSQRREALEKLGMTPSNEEFARMISSLSMNLDSNWNQIKTLLDEWFKSDRTAMCEYVVRLEPGRLFNESAISIIYSWPKDDPEGVSRYLSQVPTDSSRDVMITNAIYKFANNAPEYAKEWFAMMTDESQKSGTAIAIARGLANKSPEDAITWIETLPSESSRDRAFESFIAEFARKDPYHAMALTEKISNPDILENTVSIIVGQLARENPERAVELIEKYPPGSTRDKCCQSLIYSISMKHPETAMMWTGEIGDESARNNIISYVASTWMNGNNKDSFAEWLANAQLPQYLRKQIEKNYERALKRQQSQ